MTWPGPPAAVIGFAPISISALDRAPATQPLSDLVTSEDAMKSGHLSTVCAVAALVIVSAISGRAQQTPAPGNPPASQLLAVQGGHIRVVTLASGLVHPWSIAFLPDGSTMLVAEKNGRLRILRNGALDAQPIWTAPAPPGR